MTVSVETTRNDYSGSGTTGPFDYVFRIYDDDDLLVIVTDANGVETVLVNNTDYTVTGVGSTSGGTVTLVSALESGNKLALMRAMDYLQEQNYTAGQAVTATSLNDALDKLEMQIQQIRESTLRSFTVPRGSILTGLEVNPIAGYLLGWDSSATQLRNYPTSELSIPVLDHIGNYGDSLETAVATIGSALHTLYINKGITVSADCTIPETLKLVIPQGGLITVDSGKILTPNGPIEAGPYQIFSGSGSVLLGPGSCECVYCEWFDKDLSKAIAAVVGSGVPIQLLADTYETTGLQITSTTAPLTIRGATVQHGLSDLDLYGSVIKYTGTAGGIVVEAGSSSLVVRSVAFRNLVIDGDDLAATGLKYYGEGVAPLIDGVRIRRCTGTGFVLGDATVGGAYIDEVRNLIVDNCAKAVDIEGSAHATLFDGVYVRACTEGIDIGSNTSVGMTNTFFLTNLTINQATNYSIRAQNVRNLVVQNGYFEQSSGNPAIILGTSSKSPVNTIVKNCLFNLATVAPDYYIDAEYALTPIIRDNVFFYGIDPNVAYVKSPASATAGYLTGNSCKSTILPANSFLGFQAGADHSGLMGVLRLRDVPLASAETEVTAGAPSYTPNYALGPHHRLLLSNNATINAPTNPVDGAVLIFTFRRNSGAYTVAWNSAFAVNWKDLRLNTTIKSIGFIYDASTGKWREIFQGNEISTSPLVFRNYGSATVGDGGTIAHGLFSTPTHLLLTGTVSGEFVTGSAGASNITVAIKKHDGTAGTSQTVYWEARVD